MRPSAPVTHIGKNIVIRGYHIHHFYIGATLLAIAGWAGLYHDEARLVRIMAVVYGVGMGLFMDEIGLLLTWGDYWSRLSYTLSLVVGGFFLSVVLFNGFWRESRQQLLAAIAARTSLDRKHWILASIRAVDRTNELVRTSTARLSQGLIGVVYLLVGCLILLYPRQTHNWVAGGFLLHAISLLVRAFSHPHPTEFGERGKPSP